jgi:hypothetical protein
MLFLGGAGAIVGPGGHPLVIEALKGGSRHLKGLIKLLKLKNNTL